MADITFVKKTWVDNASPDLNAANMQTFDNALDAICHKANRGAALLAADSLEAGVFYVAPTTWTPVIRGSGTAGTYELGTYVCRYTQIGKRIFADGYIQMAAAITAGGTANLQITGLPGTRSASGFPVGACYTNNVDLLATTVSLCSAMNSGSTTVISLFETRDDGAVSYIPIAALLAVDLIDFSISYEVT